MAHKILFTDMDNTLLNADKKVSPALQQLLKAMTDGGNRLVLSSGRALWSIEKTAKEANLIFPNTLIIAANGNEIYDYDAQKYLLRKSVPMDIANRIIELAAEHNVYIQSYSDTHVLTNTDGPELAHYKQKSGMEAIITEHITDCMEHAPCKLLAVSLTEHARLEALRQDILAEFGDTVCCIFSCGEYLEIFDKTAGKGSAVRFVCDHLGVSIDDSVACGDAENDISMLDAANIGAAMSNADPQVKEHADFITSRDSDHDGLAEVIQKFFAFPGKA